jgi:deazaflavin-dependent oxidoreductase (nitroreductase family)
MALADETCCRLTTTGRVSGEPREVEIWFALEDETLYMLSGNGVRSHWVRNILADPGVSVSAGSETLEGQATVIDEPQEVARVRELVAARYDRLESSWRREGLPVAVKLDG